MGKHGLTKGLAAGVAALVLGGGVGVAVGGCGEDREDGSIEVEGGTTGTGTVGTTPETTGETTGTTPY